MRTTISMLNLDISQRVVVDTSSMPWRAGREAGVRRKRLVYDESSIGDLTCVLRLEPGACIPTADSKVSEEILVLEGSLRDEHGDHTEGSYLRYPRDFARTPESPTGCTLFVRRAQFLAGDDQHRHLQTRREPWLRGNLGLRVKPLHDHQHASTAMIMWPAGTRFAPHEHWGGEEMFILSGEFRDDLGRYPAGTWIRNPHGSRHHPFVEEDTTLLLRVGHLAPRAKTQGRVR
jgi:anti-sigma factor ChrR (cupin superfamily)